MQRTASGVCGNRPGDQFGWAGSRPARAPSLESRSGGASLTSERRLREKWDWAFGAEDGHGGGHQHDGAVPKYAQQSRVDVAPRGEYPAWLLPDDLLRADGVGNGEEPPGFAGTVPCGPAWQLVRARSTAWPTEAVPGRLEVSVSPVAGAATASSTPRRCSGRRGSRRTRRRLSRRSGTATKSGSGSAPTWAYSEALRRLDA